MKKRTKLTFAGIVTIGAAILLSGCTASFCSKDDKAHILYAFDYGVSDYYEATDAVLPTEAEKVWAENDTIYAYYARPVSTSSGIGKTDNDAAKNGINIPTLNYFKVMDRLVLEQALKVTYNREEGNYSWVTYEHVLTALDDNGYLKYAPSDTLSTNKEKLWTGWDDLNQKIRDMSIVAGSGIVIDDLPNNDYVNLYKKDMNSLIAAYRSCLAFKEGKYGYYGYAKGAHYRENNEIINAVNGKAAVTFEKKDWGYAWKKGFLEGLLIFPIGWLTDTFINGFKNIGMGGGVPQLLAIFLVTFIIRSLWLLVTFRNTRSQAKMQALQPEMAKIQNKYPNANKNQYEKQQMAAEMNRLYKKNKVNPFSTIIVMFFQFPLFICVWSAFQGLSSLTNDTFLNLHLSDTISSVLFNGANWANGSAFTALVLFLLMGISQVVAMLLPQWLSKAKRKQVASLGKNPAQKEQQSRAKMFTYIMTAMVIFMGFTLVSALGVYWFVGALFSICQTLIFDKINSSKAKKKGK